jgi:hypothetical protein
MAPSEHRGHRFAEKSDRLPARYVRREPRLFVEQRAARNEPPLFVE